MNERVDAVIWDMDGTLIDSRNAHPTAYIQAVRLGGGPEHRDQDVLTLYSLGSVKAILTELLGRPCTDRDELTYHNELERSAHMASVYEGVDDTLINIGRTGKPQLLVTGASTNSADLLLGHWGLLKHFDVIVGSDQIDSPKPAPDGILLACKCADVMPEAVAYVGDHPYDQQAARAAGAISIAAAWGHEYDAGKTQSDDLTAASPADVISLLGL